MTRRSSFLGLLATAILLTTLLTVLPTALPRAGGQVPVGPPIESLPPGLPQAFPTPPAPPLAPPAMPVVPVFSPTPPIKVTEFSSAAMDAWATKILGPAAPELKLPIRIALAEPSLAIAAQSALIVNGMNGTVEFTNATVGFGKIGEIFRCDTCILRMQHRPAKLDEVNLAPIQSMELQSRERTVHVDFGQAGQRTRTITRAVPVSTTTGMSFQAVTEQVIVNKAPDIEFHYQFRIDPKTPLASLLPAAPKTQAAIPFNDDIRKAPEISLADPVSKSLTKQQATQAIAKMMADMNHLNAKQTDGFMVALGDRPDLRGMPFRMGEECRTREAQAREFSLASEQIQTMLRAAKTNNLLATGQFWSTLRSQAADADVSQRAQVAALTQILMPESEAVRVGLAKHLATIPHADATRALARLAIFSPENDVRTAAIEALGTRRERDYSDVLIGSFQYPLPAVARRAAEALVKLDRQDLLAELVDVLEQPDPRMPITQAQDGKDVTAVRELVKVNHHRNCLLCHAPGNTESTPQAALKVMVPLPTEPFPVPDDGGPYMKPTSPLPDIVVRLDMTYLRQDFSVMMPVADAHPWPEMQRFDFLVRTGPSRPRKRTPTARRPRTTPRPPRPTTARPCLPSVSSPAAMPSRRPGHGASW